MNPPVAGLERELAPRNGGVVDGGARGRYSSNGERETSVPSDP
jgi:hypothetical protein